jgi:hypothetical protein
MQATHVVVLEQDRLFSQMTQELKVVCDYGVDGGESGRQDNRWPGSARVGP